MSAIALLSVAFVVLAGALSWMAVLLKREVDAIWSDTLNGIARDVQ